DDGHTPTLPQYPPWTPRGRHRDGQVQTSPPRCSSPPTRRPGPRWRRPPLQPPCPDASRHPSPLGFPSLSSFSSFRTRGDLRTRTALCRGTRRRSPIKSRVQREPDPRTTSPAKVTHPHGSGQGEVESPRGPATHSRTMTQREKSLGSHRQGPLSLPLHGGDVRLASLDFS